MHRNGYYGEFGGRFVPEVLVAALCQLEDGIAQAFNDGAFWDEYRRMLRDFVGRPSPLFESSRLFEASGATVAFKREDLNHTGSHKINNALGQGLLARRMGKNRLIAETGAGQHGVATATVGAQLGIPVEVFMGARDVERQSSNVRAMQLLGATVRCVNAGTQTLKEATSEALREWAGCADSTYYVVGSVVGPHPYPYLVRELQTVIGVEARDAALTRYGRLPSDVIACVGGGSNAIGMFSAFLADESVRLWGVEAAGRGTREVDTAATLGAGSAGYLHGSHSYVLQDTQGQIQQTRSVAAGLDYPGVGPEHAHLHAIGRVQYVSATDGEAIAAFRNCAAREGIVPALETAHAIAFAERLASQRGPGDLLLLSFSGRGEKDIARIELLEHASVAMQ